MVAGQGVELHSHALNLCREYFEFRLVHGDGECFYRSFIFSYLEQVLDRQDTHEEHRLLAAVKGVAKQHARLGWVWASEFFRSHKMLTARENAEFRMKGHGKGRGSKGNEVKAEDVNNIVGTILGELRATRN